MRLVDADAFKAEGRELYREAGWDLRDVHYSQMDVECNIDMMPTIEAEPVKHGRWIKLFETENDITARCSECGMVYTLGKGRDPNFCGTCGAKMDEVEE